MIKNLTEYDFKNAAQILGCEIASIKAVAEVESAGSGFIDDKNPKILFEPFVFGRLTKHKFNKKTICINGQYFPLSLKGKWSARESKYGTEYIQYKKLDEAIKLDHENALKSCSWGKFQIMGFNYYLCDYSDVFLFVNDMYKSEGKQLEIFCKFIKNNYKMHKYLIDKNWSGFARLYNGESYADNKYDIKLKNAYNKFKLEENNIKIVNDIYKIEPLSITEIPPIEPKINILSKWFKYLTTNINL